MRILRLLLTLMIGGTIVFPLVLKEATMPVNPGGGSLVQRTRSFLVPVAHSDYVDGGVVNNWEYAFPRGVLLPDGFSCKAYAEFAAPTDFVSGMTITPQLVVSGFGNAYIEVVAYYRKTGEADDQHNDSFDPTAVALSGSYVARTAGAIAFTNVAVDDIVVVQFNRMGDNGSDTFSGNIWLTGFLVSYTAEY